MAEQWQIAGKNCLVTGGASGIGAKKVEVLLKEGAAAVAILDVNEAGGQSIADHNNKTYPGKVTFVKCDIADESSVTRAFNQVLAKLKRIDVIINNAGIVNDSPDGWFTSVDVNLKGVISMTRKGLEHMGKNNGGEGGVIVNVSSVGAFMETDSVPIYCATKSAVMWFDKCLATGDFYETTGIRILTICYGATDTPIMNVKDLAFNEKHERIFQNLVATVSKQTAESAAKSCVEMIKKGKNNSIWLSLNNEPPSDFTEILDKAYDQAYQRIHDPTGVHGLMGSMVSWTPWLGEDKAKGEAYVQQ